MTDYVQTTLFGPKDGLNSGDPNKLARGTEIDTELANISTAIATKYDETDIADTVTAQGLSSNVTLMTPARVSDVLDSNAGAALDLVQLPDPGANRIPFWDQSATSLQWLQPLDSITIVGTTLQVDPANVDHDALAGFVANEHIDHSTVSVSAGTGLSGGGTIEASRTLSLDTSDTRNTDHQFVGVNAGEGLSGGGAITATRTISLDINGLTDLPGALSPAADFLVVYDTSAGTHYRVPVDQVTASGSGFVPTSRQIIAGTGLSGGGDLTADRTLTLEQATSVSLGGVQLANQATVDLGTDGTRAVTPAGLRNLRKGLLRVTTVTNIDGTEAEDTILLNTGTTLGLGSCSADDEGKTYRIIVTPTVGTASIGQGTGSPTVQYSVATGQGSLSAAQFIQVGDREVAIATVIGANQWHVEAVTSAVTT